MSDFLEISNGALVNSARGELRVDEDTAPVDGVRVLADIGRTIVMLSLAQRLNHFPFFLRLALLNAIVRLIEVFSELLLIILLSFPNGRKFLRRYFKSPWVERLNDRVQSLLRLH